MKKFNVVFFSGLIVCIYLAHGPVSAVENVVIPSALVRLIDTVNVAAPKSGIVQEVHVREGDLVELHAPLVKLDSRIAELNLRKAEFEQSIAHLRTENDAAVQLSEKNHALAVNELSRAHRINQRIAETIPLAEVERLKLEVDRTELEIVQAQHQHSVLQLEFERVSSELDLARHELERRMIRSPLKGMVVRVQKRDGEWVDEGETLVRVVRVDRLRAEAFLPAAQASRDLVSRAATLTLLLNGAQHQVQALVVFVDVEADPVNSQVRIWVDFDNDHPALRPGLRGSLVIDPARDETPHTSTAP